MNLEQAQKYFLETNNAGVTAFHVDICREQPAAVISRAPLAKKYGITPACSRDQNWTALHVAAQFAHEDAVKALLAAELFDINARDNKQRTPLHLAALSGRLDLVLLFLAAGADPTLRDAAGFTAFHSEGQSLDTAYIKFTVADLHELVQAVQPERKSHHGLPLAFATRPIPSEEPDTPKDLAAIIARYNLTGDTQILASRPVSDCAIPYYGHFFWIGGPFENPAYRENILTLQEFFPELTLLLWVDTPTAELTQWCLERHIVLLHTDLLLDKNFDNLDHYLLDVQKGNPGGAVDNLRIECLYRFGGWYFDTDVRCVKRIERADYENYHAVVFYHAIKGTAFWNNCIIAISPGNKYLKALKKRIAENYLTVRFNSGQQILSGFEMRHKMTISTSGPSGLYPIIMMNILGADPGVGLIPVKSFATSCDRNWIRPEKKFNELKVTKEQAKQALKYLVNNFLHDLTFYPPALHFDLYEPWFKKYPQYHLASFTLYFLLSFCKKAVKPVRRLITFDRLVQEINYKNEFGNDDSLAYFKKDLFMMESRYMALDNLAMQSYDVVSDLEKNRVFFDKNFWASVMENLVNNKDKEFSAEVTGQIVSTLLQDKRVLDIKKIANPLSEAWQARRIEQQRRVLAGVGEVLSKHFAKVKL